MEVSAGSIGHLVNPPKIIKNVSSNISGAFADSLFSEFPDFFLFYINIDIIFTGFGLMWM